MLSDSKIFMFIVVANFCPDGMYTKYINNTVKCCNKTRIECFPILADTALIDTLYKTMFKNYA